VLRPHLKSNKKVKSVFWQNYLMPPVQAMVHNTPSATCNTESSQWVQQAQKMKPHPFLLKYSSLVIPFLTDMQQCALFIHKEVFWKRKATKHTTSWTRCFREHRQKRESAWCDLVYLSCPQKNNQLVRGKNPFHSYISGHSWMYGTPTMVRVNTGTATPSFPHQATCGNVWLQQSRASWTKRWAE